MRAAFIGRMLKATAVMLLVALPATAHAQAATGDPIKVGVIVAVTGPAAVVGIPERNGVVLAEKVINERGGVKGRPIKLIVKDDTSNADTAISLANELIFGEKVVALIGSTASASTVAIGGITHKIKLPQIAFSGFGPAIERERTCVLHLAASQEQNARAMLEYAKSINARRMGVLHDAGFGSIVLNELKRLADGYGVQLVAAEKFEMGATDTTTQAAKVKAAQPDAIFVASVAATPMRDARRLQMTQPIISHMGSSTYELVNAMGSGADNVIFPEFVLAEDPLPHQREFVELYRKEYQVLPKNVEAMAFDGLHVLAQALGKVGSEAGGPKICEALRGPYAGVFAQYNFAADDMNGIGPASFVYSKLVAGKYTRLPFRAPR
jgi:branched-chain amino acid transport system substrate-binding protein